VAKIVFNYEYSDEELREFAADFGHPCPTDAQCGALRLEARNKIEAAVKRGLTNFGCACDGRSCFIHATNTESLIFAFKRRGTDVLHTTET
jgi:hypothetical protein